MNSSLIVSPSPIVEVSAVVTPAILSTPAHPWNGDVRVYQLRGGRKSLTPIPGMFGVFSEVTGAFLGNYSKGDKLVKNADLCALFESALSDMRLTFKRDVKTGDNGAVMYARYRIDSITYAGPDGKPIALVVNLVNSYNGKRKIEGIIEAIRLICLNGMMGFGQVFGLAKKHQSALDAVGIVQSLTPHIESGAQTFSSTLNRLAEKQIAPHEGNYILRNLRGSTNPMNFSGLMARKIEAAWEHPTADEIDSRGNLWGLYNAGTRVFRDLQAEKVELSNRAGAYFAQALIGAVEKPEWFAKLTKPITFDDAYARAN